MTKPNKDGWIRHRGGKCPVDEYQRIKYRMRSGVIMETHAGGLLNWDHGGWASDIMAWRPHKPSILDEPGEPNDALKEVLELDAPKEPEALVIDYSPSLHVKSFGRVYRHEGDPRKMRDRIREIDAASKEEEARHCAAMAAYDAERASMVAKLKAEGFVLIQSDKPNSMEESAQQDIAQQDMSDPANWRVGDVVEIESSTNDGWLSRKGMFGNLEWDGEWRIEFNGKEDWYISDNTKVKWHSRPAN